MRLRITEIDGADDGNRTRITSLGIKITAILFSQLAYRSKKSTCIAVTDFAYRCRTFGGRFLLWSAFVTENLRLTFAAQHKHPLMRERPHTYQYSAERSPGAKLNFENLLNSCMKMFCRAR